LHGPFVSDDEVEKVVKFLKSQGSPEYVDAVTEEEPEDGSYGEGPVGDDEAGGGSGDDLYDQAVAVVLRDKKVSTSYIQRRLQVGYNKAASLIERMEKEGLISQANATGKREILVPGDSARP
jgi:S-DNA-T family DNA segregation ATPase FtsK/SpoIIIE